MPARATKSKEKPKLRRVSADALKAITIGVRLTEAEYAEFCKLSGDYAPATFARALILKHVRESGNAA